MDALPKIFLCPLLFVLMTGCFRNPEHIEWLAELDTIIADSLYSQDVAIVDAFQQKKLALKSVRGYRSNLETFVLFLHANGLYAASALAYDELLFEDPYNPVWPYLYAKVLQDYGEVEQALSLLDRSLELDPGYALTYYVKAELLMKTGRRDQALLWYEKSLAKNPRLAHALIGRARIELDRGDLQSAKMTLQQAIERDATLSSSYSLMAGLLEREGEIDRADTYRQMSVKLGRFREPVDERAEQIWEHCLDPYQLSVVADQLNKAGRRTAAIGFLEKARELEPEDASLCVSLGQAYIQENRMPEGLKLLDLAIELAPEDPHAYIAKAAELAIAGRTQDSLNVVELGISKTGPSAFLYKQKGLLLGELGDETGMGMMLIKAVEVEPENGPCNLALGNYLWSIGAKDSAIYYLETACDLSPTEYKARALLAHYYLEKRQFEKAERRLREVETLRPNFVVLKGMQEDLYLKWGNHAFGKKDLNHAETLFLRVLELNPKSEQALNNWALVLAASGRAEEAIQTLSGKITKSPKPELSQLVLITSLCLDSGKKEQARKWLELGVETAQKQGEAGAERRFKGQLNALDGE